MPFAQEVVRRQSNIQGSNQVSTAFRLAFAPAIWHIWRDSRIFRKNPSLASTVLKSILCTINIKMKSCTAKEFDDAMMLVRFMAAISCLLEAFKWNGKTGLGE